MLVDLYARIRKVSSKSTSKDGKFVNKKTWWELVVFNNNPKFMLHETFPLDRIPKKITISFIKKMSKIITERHGVKKFIKEHAAIPIEYFTDEFKYSVLHGQNYIPCRWEGKYKYVLMIGPIDPVAENYTRIN